MVHSLNKLIVAVEESCNKFKNGVNKIAFSLLMYRIAINKASMINNKRRIKGKPLIRKRAYIKAWKNRYRNK